MRPAAKALAALFAPALLAASGCASIGNTGRQTLPLESDPPGAAASWDRQTITTPGSIVIPRKTDHLSVRFEKAGHVPCVVTLKRERDGAYWANLAWIPAGLLAGGVIGYSTSSHHEWLGGLSETLIGALVGGAAFPAVAFAIDAGSERSYEQSPTRVKVALASLPPGQGGAPQGSEAPCSLLDEHGKPVGR